MSDDFWWINFILGKDGVDDAKQILRNLDKISREKEVYPDPEYIFRAFTILNETKVVIVGQDPYHGRGQANGYAFAVNRDQDMPPSLQNIFKELRDDIGAYKANRTLEAWANQGVMLLNTTLTVSKGEPGSHYSLGWIKITSKVIEYLSSTRDNLVFILWGAHAQKMALYIENYDNHLVIKAPHPSPLSAHKGFFGSKPFSRTNAYLIEHKKDSIEW
jgi:uracil-DNA glycosylase